MSVITSRQAAMLLLPSHDPTVARTVGAMFSRQADKGEAEKVLVQGEVSDFGNMRLEFSRQQDGSVAVDGYLGPLEVHEEIRAVPVNGGRGESRAFGIAGSESSKSHASVSGTIDGEPVDLGLFTSRRVHEVAHTDELQEKGLKTFTWRSRSRATPTFGGPPVDFNQVPGTGPTPSTPLQTTDTTTVRGTVAGIELRRSQDWTTTTWTVSYNGRDGFDSTDYYQSERASESEQLKVGDWSASNRADYQVVSHRSAEASGELNGLARERRYDLLLDKGAVEVHQRLGDTEIEYHIVPMG